MQVSVGEQPRRANGFVQGISMLVLAAMVCLSLRPLCAAAAARPNTGGRPVAVVPSVQSRVPVSAEIAPDEQYGQSLEALKALLNTARGQTQAGSDAASFSTSDAQRRVQSLRDQIQQLEKLEPVVDASFVEIGRRLDDKRLSQEIKARHHSAEVAFKQKRKEMKRLLEKFKVADAAGDDAGRERALEELGAFLSANQPGYRHSKLNPNKLPWQVSSSKVRKPAQSLESLPRWQIRSSAPTGTKKESMGSSARTALERPLASALSETDDVQITHEIRELATSLGNNPVKIYNWVRNNIEYVPSFGLIQGSSATLSKKQGNAFDTASLLIALFRASGIPARYVFGTIQVPASAAMNWVGGVSKPEAAQQLWGQGGVPNAAMVSDGRITSIQLEHVWVEAWVDFVPSRGQKHVQGDTWVSLDASFKQYTDEAGLAAETHVPVDADAIRSAFLSGALVNETEGWVQTPNIAAIQAAQDSYMEQFLGAIRQVKPAATNDDVYGERIIIKEEPETLTSSLPYKPVFVGARYSELPGELIHKFRYTIYANGVDQSSESPLLAFTESLPRLAGRQVMLVYAPATQADVELLTSLMPASSQPTAEEFSAVRFPAYLLRLKPEIIIDGIVRATGGVVSMGTELSATGAFTRMDLVSGWEESSAVLTAGQVTAIGLNLQGMDLQLLKRLKARVDTAKGRIEQRTFDGLTGFGIGADIMTAAIWSYLSNIDLAGRATRSAAHMVDFPALSFGLAHVDLDVSYSFGIARSARVSGFLLDISHLRSIRWSKEHDKSSWVRYNRVLGQYASAMEHRVLEEIFLRKESPGNAVSAVTLIGRAVAAGQRVYTITRANLDVALPRLELNSDVLEDIRSAVAAGMEVTVHQKPIDFTGWSGTGYTVIDPQTGAGAYLIQGGANGGKAFGAAAGVVTGTLSALFMLLLTSLVALNAPITLAGFGAAVLVGAMLFAVAWYIGVVVQSEEGDEAFACYAGGFMAGWQFVANWFPSFGSKLVAAVMGLLGWVVAGSAFWQCRTK